MMTLQEKAMVVLVDEEDGGHRWLMLCLEVSVRTGLSPNEVRDRIYALAAGGEVDEWT